jgi:hypothetical protein
MAVNHLLEGAFSKIYTMSLLLNQHHMMQYFPESTSSALGYKVIT